MSQPHFWPLEAIPSRIIFHSDFDGICSAALLGKFFANHEIIFEPVNYSIKPYWLNRRLENAAVVDFLFHPEALWWFDHHSTTFINEEIKRLYSPSPNHRWNTGYGSCPMLILDVLNESADVSALKSSYHEWIEWSEIIDSAKYSSPQQAILGEEPCVLLNQALSTTASLKLRELMVHKIIKGITPKELSQEADVKNLWEKFRKQQEIGLNVIKNKLEIINTIGYCNIIGTKAPFIRYGIYYFSPKLPYSLIVYDSKIKKHRYSISISRNPWIETTIPQLDLGVLARKYGGGGRTHVASVSSDEIDDCKRLAKQILAELSNSIKGDR